MNPTLVTVLTAVALFVGAVASAVVARWTAATSRAKLVQDLDDRRRAERTAEMAAHTTAQAALAAVSEQLASSSYQYADRLRVELERLEQRHADEMVRASQQIDSLRMRVSDMQEEIHVLRGQLRDRQGMMSP